MWKFNDNDYDQGEYGAILASFVTNVPISDKRLFNLYTTSSTVIKDVSIHCPRLAPSNPDVAAVLTAIKPELQTAPPLQLPQLERDPATWPATNDDMDAFWLEAVRGERDVSLGTTFPQGLIIEEELLVKPFGSFKDLLLFISSYPTKDSLSTVHHRYGMMNDLSNICMWRIYAKLGFQKLGRPSGILHVDVFPRRIDRKQSLFGNGHVLHQIPANLRKYWNTHASNMISCSSARIGIVLGHSAAASYQMHLERKNIRYQCL